MKNNLKIILVAVVVLSFFLTPGCKQSGDSILTIYKAEWKLVHNDTGGDDIYLHLSGSTTGEKVTLITHGDGFDETLELNLNQFKTFNQEILIAFSNVRYTTPVTMQTVVTAYSSEEQWQISLTSGELY